MTTTNKATSTKPAANKGTSKSHNAAAGKKDAANAAPKKGTKPEVKPEVLPDAGKGAVVEGKVLEGTLIPAVPGAPDADAVLPGVEGSESADAVLKGSEGSLLDAAGKVLDGVGDLSALDSAKADPHADVKQYVQVVDNEVKITYPEPDYSTVKMPVLEEVIESMKGIELAEPETNITPIAALRAGNVSRVLDYAVRNLSDVELQLMIRTLMTTALMLPVLRVRQSIDRYAEHLASTYKEEQEAREQEAKDQAARESLLEMQQTMIENMVQRGLSVEAAEQQVQAIIDNMQPTPRKSSGGSNAGGQFNYNRVLIKCGEHEFEMGERGFHPRIAQELWEKEGITKEEFVKKYTAKIVRQGSV